MKLLHNISRIEAFSDAVFAFAATLLVVSLEDENSSSILKIEMASFVGFFVSFFVLVLLWQVHYKFFRRTNYLDNWIITFNSILLFVVLYFVFPLKSLINSMFGKLQVNEDSLSSLFIMYGWGIALIFTAISLMYFRAYKKDVANENRIYLLFCARHFAIFIGVSLTSIVLSSLKVGLVFGAPGFMYLILGPLCYAHGVWFNKKFNATI